jgi:hypothetical protein
LNPDPGIRIRMHWHYFWYNSRIRTTSGSEIICILHFDDFFDGSGSEDPDPGSRPIQQLLENFYCGILREKRILASLSGSGHVFTFLELLKGCGTRFEE